jgi:hypothetical protein
MLMGPRQRRIIGVADRRGSVMTGHAMNAKSEALELREVSAAELDRVSGGFFGLVFRSENQEQLQALKTFKAALESAKGL